MHPTSKTSTVCSIEMPRYNPGLGEGGGVTEGHKTQTDTQIKSVGASLPECDNEYQNIFTLDS